jgi:hypothetical protein
MGMLIIACFMVVGSISRLTVCGQTYTTGIQTTTLVAHTANKCVLAHTSYSPCLLSGTHFHVHVCVCTHIYYYKGTLAGYYFACPGMDIIMAAIINMIRMR